MGLYRKSDSFNKQRERLRDVIGSLKNWEQRRRASTDGKIGRFSEHLHLAVRHVMGGATAEKLSCERNTTGGDAFWKLSGGLLNLVGLSQHQVSPSDCEAALSITLSSHLRNGVRANARFEFHYFHICFFKQPDAYDF